MNKIFKQWMKRYVYALVGVTLLASCTDDHFDVKSSADGGRTLWQNIEANPQLKNFADILRRTKVLKGENDRNSTLSAAELLNQPQSFTLWAPLDDSYNAQQWKDTLAAAESDMATGTPEAIAKARTLYYIVWDQFVSNHIARFNHEGYSGNQEIKMLNGKNYSLSATAFGSKAIEGSAINSSNGSMHLLDGAAPFAYNIYDYLGHHSGFSEINSYIKNPKIDRRQFSEELSVPGAMNEDGHMVYIDSAYIHYNDLLDASRARISNEDSLYVALIPDNTAWEQALTKVSSIFNYGSRYSYDWNGADFRNNRTNNKQYKLDVPMFSDPHRTLADSLQSRNVRENIVKNMFFARYPIKGAETMDSSALIHHFQYADSLISTARVTFFNPAAENSTAVNGNLNPALANLFPYRASNGYIFELKQYSFDPAYIWVQDRSFQPFYSFYLAYTDNLSSPNGTTVSLTDNNYNKAHVKLGSDGNPVLGPDGKPIMEGVSGDIEGKRFQRFEMSNERTDMLIDFRLDNLFSAKYTIQLVMVPSQVDLDIQGVDNEVVKFDVEMLDDNGDKVPFTVGTTKVNTLTIDQENGDFDQSKVNTISLGTYIEIPKCYVGLPSDYVSFPRLRLRLPKKGRTAIKCKALNIVKVIVKPYRGQ